MVTKLLMPETPNWADEWRIAHPETASWHFVNYPENNPPQSCGCTTPNGCSGDGCVLSAITTQTAILLANNCDLTSDNSTTLAIQYLTHFIGELLNPSTTVNDKREETTQKRFTTGRRLISMESTTTRYPRTDFSRAYYEAVVDILNVQIAKGGFRIAAWLNAIADECDLGRKGASDDGNTAADVKSMMEWTAMVSIGHIIVVLIAVLSLLWKRMNGFEWWNTSRDMNDIEFRQALISSELAEIKRQGREKQVYLHSE
ncbi:hypothetical protein BCR33DRAFT_718510 [Rhizoclosmatium globosum]|uniref:Phospholipase C/P1 nuclease n=1 Tax=Rhizoclosmatium globosum TaxID=329046 RepID=A0A1Y2C622_9FUNG|nr:hypothetical protein BCR33DRAFT_718510 [Rhizoclosmatium globosum]|eukprot:ORY42386.1 hypothetical protein BCR33DRAFT_718510 [Rhizoclosmatium globosum]